MKPEHKNKAKNLLNSLLKRLDEDDAKLFFYTADLFGKLIVEMCDA